MGFLGKFFGGGSSSGGPITLEFACDHPTTNPTPPKLTAREREQAQTQAKQVRCSKCDPSGWSRFETQGSYRELRRATQRK